MSTIVYAPNFNSGFTTGVDLDGQGLWSTSDATGANVGGIKPISGKGYGSATTQSGVGLQMTVANANAYAVISSADGQNGEQQLEVYFFPNGSTNFGVSAELRVSAFTGVHNEPNTCYRIGVNAGGGSISKSVSSGGIGSTLNNCSLAPAGFSWTSGIWYRLIATAIGTSTTTLRLQIQRDDDKRWLFADGSWYPAQSPHDFLITQDTSSPITGSNRWGLRLFDVTGSVIAIDKVKFTAGITCGALTPSAVTDTAISVQAAAPSVGGVAPYSLQYQSSPHGANTWSNLGAAVTGIPAPDRTFPILSQIPSASASQTGLTANTTYDYQAVLSDANGLTDTTPTLPVTTLASTPKNYYFAAPGNGGNDANSGLDSLHPKSNNLATINGISYNPGDAINLHGGDSFGDDTNGRSLVIPLSGVAGAPITVQSYGAGQATLACDDKWAIQVNDQQYHTYQNMTITARSIGTNGIFTPSDQLYDQLTSGVIELNSNSQSGRYFGVTFKNITGSGGKRAFLSSVSGGRASLAPTIDASGVIQGATLHQGRTGNGFYSSGSPPTISVIKSASNLGSGAGITASIDGSGNVVLSGFPTGTAYSRTATILTAGTNPPGYANAAGYDGLVIDGFTWSNCCTGITINGPTSGYTDSPTSLVPRNANQNCIVRNVTITNALGQNDLADATTGTGIVLFGCFNCLVEKCYVSGSGGQNTNTSGGSVGVWGTRSDLLYFRRCGVDSQTNGSAVDGDAFDADIASTRFVFDQCWSRNCKGVGWLVFNNAGSPAQGTSEIYFKNCASVNDNTAPRTAVARIGGGNTSRGFIVNCTIYQGEQVSVPLVDGSWYMINSLLISKNSSTDIFINTESTTSSIIARVNNNDFWDLNSGGTFNAKAVSTAYTSVSAFQSAGAVAVLTSDPQVKNNAIGFPGTVYNGIVAAQSQFTSLDPTNGGAYTIGKGVNPFSTFAGVGSNLMIVPTADFHGTVYSANPTYSLGATVFVANNAALTSCICAGDGFCG